MNSDKHALEVNRIRANATKLIQQHARVIETLASAVADVDAAMMQATEATVDDRAAMLDAARQLALLVESEVR